MTDIGTRLIATIPALGDPANIVTAFTDYHTDIDAKAAILAASNAFTSTNSFSAATTFSAPVTLSTSTATLIFNDGTNIEGRMLASSGVFYIQAGTTSGDTSAELRLTRNGTATTNMSSLKVYADVSAFYGTVFPLQGTALVAPIQFTSGINLTTPVPGTMEYSSGLPFFTNNDTTKRGLLSPKHIYSLTSTRSLSTTAGTISLFGLGLALEANTVYEFELSFAITLTCGTSTNSNVTLSVALPTSSTVSYHALHSSSTTSTSPLQTFATETATPATTASLNFNGTSVPLTAQYRMRGTIRTSSTAGSFIPNLVLANSGGIPSSLVLSAGSYATVNKVGAANANIVTGQWA
jgi:hypothetical protein